MNNPFGQAEIVEMLKLRGDAQQQLFAEARRKRSETWGDRIVLRGVVEITNLCKVNCDYCPMRRDNTKSNDTYLMTVPQIMEAVEAIKAAGIKVVFFQAGEIPQTTKIITEVIPQIRALFQNDVEILLNLGNKPHKDYARFKELGANTYIIKHETSDPDLHLKIRHEPLEERLSYMRDLLELGFKVGTGTIIGLPGQTIESIAQDLLLGQALGVHMMSASTFVPAPNTPMDHLPNGSLETTLNYIAISRLMNPEWLIPSVSALEKVSKDGQLMGLEAGANVMTVNFTPDYSLQKYLIYGKDRYIVKRNHVETLLEQVGLRTFPERWYDYLAAR